MKRQLTFSIIILMLVGVMFAQQPPTGAPPIKPPEIKADGSVIFRLAAPNARTVLVRNTTGGWAEWPQGNDLAMSKDDQGIWSITVGPVKPEFYTYTFVVDGVQALDLRNPLVSRDGSRYSSSLRISGEKTD